MGIAINLKKHNWQIYLLFLKNQITRPWTRCDRSGKAGGYKISMIMITLITMIILIIKINVQNKQTLAEMWSKWQAWRMERGAVWLQRTRWVIVNTTGTNTRWLFILLEPISGVEYSTRTDTSGMKRAIRDQLVSKRPEKIWHKHRNKKFRGAPDFYLHFFH